MARSEQPVFVCIPSVAMNDFNRLLQQLFQLRNALFILNVVTEHPSDCFPIIHVQFLHRIVAERRQAQLRAQLSIRTPCS